MAFNSLIYYNVHYSLSKKINVKLTYRKKKNAIRNKQYRIVFLKLA